jgi:hypothetical protein
MDLVAGAAGTLLGLGAMLCVPVYFVLQPWLAVTMRGGWRRAALAPLLFAVPLFTWCMWALAAESNLWPLPLILFAPFGTVYLVVLFAVSRASAARARG